MTALSQQLNDLKSSTSMSSLTNLQQSSRLVSLETELANAHAMQAAAASELAAAQQQLGLARTQAMAQVRPVFSKHLLYHIGTDFIAKYQATAKIQTIESRAAEVEEALRAQSQQHEKALRQLRDQMYDERTVWETERQQVTFLQFPNHDLMRFDFSSSFCFHSFCNALALIWTLSLLKNVPPKRKLRWRSLRPSPTATPPPLIFKYRIFLCIIILTYSCVIALSSFQASKAAAASAQQRLRDVMTGNNDGAQALNDRYLIQFILQFIFNT
jgi:hypothetical protein